MPHDIMHDICRFGPGFSCFKEILCDNFCSSHEVFSIEYTLEGHPRRERNPLKAATNAFEVNSDTASRWMAFVAKHTNKQTYPLVVVLSPTVKLLMSNGPAKKIGIR